MPLTVAQRTKFLDAIETDSLMFLCGAGLSMASPSNLPSALRVSQMCYDDRMAIETLAPALRDNIDKLADLFHARGDFKRVFIPLVPWNELMGQPNKGHAAIADLLITKAAHAAMSSNFDHMIETWGQGLKADLQGALNGQEATSLSVHYSPLLKFHGCIEKNRNETLWTTGQLAEPDIQSRVASCSQWMNLHLPHKHLVVVGFWSDWGYLNKVLEDAFTIGNAAAVTVIDPSPEQDLQNKAPDLWTKLNALSQSFEHIPESGAEILDELREAYSHSWSVRFYGYGRNVLNAQTNVAATVTTMAAVGPAVVPANLAVDALYDLRRDVEGIPYTHAATLKRPLPTSAQAALMHATLLDLGATKHNSWLRYQGKLIRVVNGAGRFLEDVQGTFKEPASIPYPDMVVCAGSVRTGAPAQVIAVGRGESVVRPASGNCSKWLTADEAKTELNI